MTAGGPTNASSKVRLTNLSTGESVVHRSHYFDVFRIADNGDVVANTRGRITSIFWPGDVGPDGSILTEAMLLSVVGHQRWRYDGETFALTEYSLKGRIAADLCARLSG